MSTKVIQIAVISDTESDDQAVFALTETGDIWKLPLTYRTQSPWQKLPPIPSEPNDHPINPPS